MSAIVVLIYVSVVFLTQKISWKDLPRVGKNYVLLIMTLPILELIVMVTVSYKN
jgi:hypothetical protein